MGFALRKAEREKGLSEVEILALACRRFRKKFPSGDFNGWLIRALNERRCYRQFQYYRNPVRAELHRLDEQDRNKQGSKKSSVNTEESPADLSGTAEDIPQEIMRLKGPLWARLDPIDKAGTMIAMTARRDQLLLDD